MKRGYLKAASTLEYSLLIAVIVAALLGIQIYVKRAISARWQQAGDTFGSGRQIRVPGLIWDK